MLLYTPLDRLDAKRSGEQSLQALKVNGRSIPTSCAYREIITIYSLALFNHAHLVLPCLYIVVSNCP